MAALCLCCCIWGFSGCSEQELVFLTCGLLVAEHRLRGFRTRSTQAQQWRLVGFRAQTNKLLRGVWNLPGPGITPVVPALIGGFLSTSLTGKSLFISFHCL